MQTQGAMEMFLNTSKTALVIICYTFRIPIIILYSTVFNQLYFIPVSVVILSNDSYRSGESDMRLGFRCMRSGPRIVGV